MQKLQKNTTNELIDLFKPINPCHDRLFAMKNQRGAIERMVRKFGEDKVRKVIQVLPQCQGKPFCPVITTPYELEMKLGKLILWFKQVKEIKQVKGGSDLSEMK